MILITGATGTIGRELVRHLAGRGEPVRAMTRDPSRVDPPRGVEVVYGDLDRPETLTGPATGVSALFLLTAPGPAVPAHDLAMLDAARAAGVRTVVKLSAIGTAESDNAMVRTWHAPGEDAVRASGLAWTILRPSDLASNTLSWAAPIRSGHPVPNPTGTGARGVIDPRDIAEAAATALTTSDHAGRTYTLTGPALLTTPAQVATLADLLSRPLETTDIPPETHRTHLLAAGRDAAFTEVALDGAAYVRRGGAALLTRAIQTLTGHPPRTYRSWAESHRASFT